MPSITIPFPTPLNVSIQVGDVLYSSQLVPANTNPPWSNSAQGGTNNPNFGGFVGTGANVNTKPIEIGIVTGVDFENQQVTIQTDGFAFPATSINDPKIADGYLFFSKDITVNTSGIVGYFAEVEYRNNSNSHAEIFATAVDYVESSK